MIKTIIISTFVLTLIFFWGINNLWAGLSLPLEISLKQAHFEAGTIQLQLGLKNQTDNFYDHLVYQLELYQGEALAEEGYLFEPLTEIITSQGQIGSLAPQEELSQSISYQPPLTLEAGQYFIRLLVLDQPGNFYGGTYTQTGLYLDGQGGFLANLQAYLQTSQGNLPLKTDQPLETDQVSAIVIPLAENVQLAEQLKQGKEIKSQLSIYPAGLGQAALEQSAKKPVVVSEQEGQPVIVYPLDLSQLKPGSYALTLDLFNQENQLISQVSGRITISGLALRIKKIITQTNYYAFGNPLDIEVLLNYTSPEQTKEVNLELSLIDQEKKPLSFNQTITLMAYEPAREIKVDFSRFKVSRDLRVKEIRAAVKDGPEILDEYQISLKPVKEDLAVQPALWQKKWQMALALILLALIVIVLLVTKLAGHQDKVNFLAALLFLLASALILGVLALAGLFSQPVFQAQASCPISSDEGPPPCCPLYTTYVYSLDAQPEGDIGQCGPVTIQVWGDWGCEGGELEGYFLNIDGQPYWIGEGPFGPIRHRITITEDYDYQVSLGYPENMCKCSAFFRSISKHLACQSSSSSPEGGGEDEGQPGPQPPYQPELISPVNRTWLQQKPVFFMARVSDPDNDNLLAIFDLNAPGSSDDFREEGSLVASGQISQLAPPESKLNSLCYNQWINWRAKARDETDLESGWTNWWKFKIDRTLPLAEIDYPSGPIYTDTFLVSLDQSDDCSEPIEGDVDVKVTSDSLAFSPFSPLAKGGLKLIEHLNQNGFSALVKPLLAQDSGGWQDYATTMDNFYFQGSKGYCYQFRYRVKDQAGNWSSFDQGDQVCLRDNQPPVAEAGPVQVLEREVPAHVSLDGSASYDPDHQPAPLTYQWEIRFKPAQSQAFLSDPTSVRPELIADQWGAYRLSLVVNDGQLESQPDSTVVYLKLCGNGILEYNEECDDGNRLDNDGCSAQCLIEEAPQPWYMRWWEIIPVW